MSCCSCIVHISGSRDKSFGWRETLASGCVLAIGDANEGLDVGASGETLIRDAPGVVYNIWDGVDEGEGDGEESGDDDMHLEFWGISRPRIKLQERRREKRGIETF